MYKFSKTLALAAFAVITSALNADIKEITPKIYKEHKDWALGGDIDPAHYAIVLEALVFGGAIDGEGNITDHEIVAAFAACVAEGSCNWPTKPSGDSNITSPDQVAKILHAAIAHKNLDAQKATEAAKKTQLWCDNIPMKPFFGKDKYKLERASCNRLHGFYTDVAYAQENPSSQEGHHYYARLSRNHSQYKNLMAEKLAAQQN